MLYSLSFVLSASIKKYVLQRANNTHTSSPFLLFLEVGSLSTDCYWICSKSSPAALENFEDFPPDCAFDHLESHFPFGFYHKYFPLF